MMIVAYVVSLRYPFSNVELGQGSVAADVNVFSTYQFIEVLDSKL